MNKFRLTIFSMLLCTGSIAAQTTVNEQSLDSLLRSIYQKDQSIRYDIISHFQTGNTDSIIFYSAKMDQVDQENQRVVFDLLDTAGWPTNVSDSHIELFS